MTYQSFALLGILSIVSPTNSANVGITKDLLPFSYDDDDLYIGASFTNLRKSSDIQRSREEFFSKYPNYTKPKSHEVLPGDPNINVTYSWELECYHRYQYCVGPPLMDWEINGYASVCSCHDMCTYYGDCCMGYPIFNKSFIKSKNNISRWSCKPISVIKERVVNFYVMEQCSDDWKDSAIKNQCEQPDPEDVLATLPVTGKHSQITYANTFCALCNRDLKIVPWNPLVDCSDSFHSFLKDSVQNTTIKPNCSSIEYALWYQRNVKPQFRRYAFPSGFNKSIFHECQIYENHINSCSEEWVSQQTDSEKVIEYIVKCNAFVAPVYRHVPLGDTFSKTTRYKNKFCAFCNDIQASDLSCDPKILGYFVVSPAPSVGILLDIDIRKGSQIVGTSEHCPPFHIYDPWVNECRRIWCIPSNFTTNYTTTCSLELENNTTSRVAETWISTTRETDIKKCPLAFRFEFGDYYLKDDGSAIVYVSEQILYPNEFIILANGTLFTCFTGGQTAIIEFTELQATISMWGSITSIVALVIKIALFLLPTEEKRNLPSKMMLFLSITLLIAQLLFVGGVNRTEIPVVCKLTGILMHYAYLSSFFWMNTLAYDMWKTFTTFRRTKTLSSTRQMLYYCLYGWGVPAVIIVTSVIINWTVSQKESWSPGYGENLCWISKRLGLLIYFASPIGILLALNIVFFFLISFSICKTTHEVSLAHGNKQKKQNDFIRFLLYVKLAIVMGLTWSFGFIAAYASSTFLWYLFIAFNTLQGLFIFIAFSEFRKLRKFLKCPKCQRSLNCPRKSYETGMSGLSQTTKLNWIGAKLKSFS